MRKKWNSSGGFTLIEMLCAVTVLLLLCLMLGSGMQAAMTTYRAITAKSETQLLLNTLVNAIAGELRYAQELELDAEGNLTYSDGLSLTVSEGRILAGGTDLLPRDKDGKGGAYHGGAYQAEGLELAYDPDTACFILRLKVVWTGGSITAETPEDGIAIRCLNPPEIPELPEVPETPPEGGTP